MAKKSKIAKNEQRKVEGQDPIDEGPIVTLAEQLLVKVRAAEWRDRAEAALRAAGIDPRSRGEQLDVAAFAAIAAARPGEALAPPSAG